MRTFFAFGTALTLALVACGSDSASSSTSSSSAGGGTTGSDSTSGSGSTAATGSSGSGGAAAAAFQIQVYAADPAVGAVNSYLVLGDKEAMVVDGQFFKADALKVVDLIKASSKTLTTVFLTHAHPDHYLGLKVIADAFPKAKIVATKAVVDDFNLTAQGTFMYLKGMYADALADGLAVPEALAGNSLLLDGRSLDVIEMPNPGESSVAAAIALDAPSALLAGDLVYNDIHLVLSSCAWKGWLDNLTAIKAKGFQDVYPGHGAKASMAVFDADAQYINDVVPILEAAATTDEAKMKIKAKYPAYLSDLLLGFSTDGYFMSSKGK